MPEVLTDVELVLEARAEVGEGPVWDAEHATVMWVDILRGLIHRLEPRSGQTRTIHIGQPVGSAHPRASGGLVLAAGTGFATVAGDGTEFQSLASVENGRAGMRMNDGACDAAGRFWAGTMEYAGARPVGSLYRLGTDRSVARVFEGVTISNGIAWSPDSTRMYYVDTPTSRVDVLDFDLASGSVDHRRELASFPLEWGSPDGMTVDADGHLWIAFCGSGSVRRFDPDGSLVAIIELPVSQVTSCAFGGNDFADLYITTATHGLSAQRLAVQPLAGSLFKARPSVHGLPASTYGG